MISFGEYKGSIGKFYNEEPFDFLIYRPIAYLIVKLTYGLPLTPNHFSFLSILTSITAGLFLAMGTGQGFLWGGIGIVFFCVWDCCDGMLARMKKNGSMYGKYVDRVSDLFANTSFLLGAFIGFHKYQSGFSLIAISIPVCGVFILVHVATYQFYKNQMDCYLANNPAGQKRELENLEASYRRLKESQTQPFHVILLKTCLLFSKLQKEPKPIVEYDVGAYVKANKLILPLWGVLAGSTHLTIFAVALVVRQIEVYVVYALLFANLWAMLVFRIQRGANNKVRVVP